MYQESDAYVYISGVDFEKNFQGGAKINGGVPEKMKCPLLKQVT